MAVLAPQLDAVGAGGAALSASSISWTQVVNNNTNRALFVFVTTGGASKQAATSVQLDPAGANLALTKLGSVASGVSGAGFGHVDVWLLLAPPVGTWSVQANGPSGAEWACGSSSWFNINQATPYDLLTTAQGAVGAGLSASLVLTGAANGDTIIGAAVDDNNAATGTLADASGQTRIFYQNAGSGAHQGAASYMVVAASDVTFTWSGFASSSDNYGCIGLRLIGVTVNVGYQRWGLEDDTGAWALEDGTGYWLTEVSDPSPSGAALAASLLTASTASGALSVPKPLGVSMLSASTATANMGVPKPLAAILLSASSATFGLTTKIRLNASLTSASSAAVGLTTQIRLGASLVSASTASVTLKTTIRLAAALTTASTGAAGLTTQIRLAASLTTASSGSATLTGAPIHFAASALSASSASASLLSASLFGARMLSASTAAAGLTTGIRLAANLTTASTASVVLTTRIRLAAAMLSASSGSAAFGIPKALVVSMLTTSTGAASLTARTLFRATLTSAATATAALGVPKPLRATLVSTSSMVALFGQGVAFTATALSASFATAALTARIQLAARLAATSSAAAALRAQTLFAAVLVLDSSGSAALRVLTAPTPMDATVLLDVALDAIVRAGVSLGLSGVSAGPALDGHVATSARLGGVPCAAGAADMTVDTSALP
jgi:hypothetical protein